jgi:hypothetical protein
MLTKDEVREIALGRLHGRCKGIGHMPLPTGGCSACDHKPCLTFKQIDDIWNQWYLDNNYVPEVPGAAQELTDQEILDRRGRGTHGDLRCWNRPEGCSCDTKPHMPFAQVRAEWLAWQLSKEGSPLFPVEVDSD